LMRITTRTDKGYSPSSTSLRVMFIKSRMRCQHEQSSSEHQGRTLVNLNCIPIVVGGPTRKLHQPRGRGSDRSGDGQESTLACDQLAPQASSPLAATALVSASPSPVASLSLSAAALTASLAGADTLAVSSASSSSLTGSSASSPLEAFVAPSPLAAF